MTIARAYYNEIDPFAAAWLRELIKAGEIMPGDVDERDIRDVVAEDLHGYSQCHFFAGIGVWSYALRCAGWADDKPVWTGSCPCQPFSAAGKAGGFDDERHLWPAWHHLIRICRPPVVFGEQVASSNGLAWLDLVQADMEGTRYAIGAADLCAAGFGAPHIRQRLWFVAERLADLPSERRHGRKDTAGARGRHSPEDSGAIGRVAHGISPRLEGARPTDGFWRDADWLFCRDGKWRPIRPSAQQMVDGSAASLGRLRAEEIEAVEEAVEQWATRHQADGRKAVRDLWDVLSAEEVEQRTDGGFDSVREAPFLLAFLRQLSDQGWNFPIGDERAGSEASRRSLRVLRYDEEPGYSSRGRGLDEQRPEEPTDPLRQLSQILAHYTEVSWGQSGWQNVGSFPLARNAADRVGRLRGYGNAIVAPVAQAVIEAYQHEAVS